MTRYADGVMTAAVVRNVPGIKKPYTDEMIERAMSDAVLMALSDGVDMNSPEMRQRILDARVRVKNAAV